MCQITYISGKNKSSVVNTLINFQMLSNSVKNKDGWGFYNITDGSLYKDKEKATTSKSYLPFLQNLTYKSYSILLHTRLASVLKTTITDENAHPFDKDNLILVHNGTLTKKDGTTITGKTDSEDFAENLSNNLNNLSMEEALKKTYEIYDGKFAFGIFSKKDNKVYFARGKTATLFKAIITIEFKDGKKLNYLMINTEKDDLVTTLDLSKLFLMGNNSIINLEYKVDSLEENSIFTIKDGDLIKIDTLEETKKEYARVTYSESTINSYERGLGNILYESGLSYPEVMIALLIASKNTKTPQEINLLNLNNISSITVKSEVKNMIDGNTDRKKVAWKSILEKVGENKISDIYKENNLEFPFMLNSEETLENICKSIS